MTKRNLFLVVFMLASCSDHQKRSDYDLNVIGYKPDSTAQHLNNKASVLIGNAAHTYDSLKIQLYDSAIVYLNQAIEIDSLCLLAYTNKAQALQRKGSIEEALRVLKKVEVITPGFAEVLAGQGFLLEKMGKMELADEKYRQALNAYRKRLADDRKNEKVQSDIAFLYIFLEGKNDALHEIRSLLVSNPESEQLKMMEGIIKDFDRQKFIGEY